VRGCNALVGFMEDSMILCEDCPNKPVSDNTYTWGDACDFECDDGHYLTEPENGPIDCLPCTSFQEQTCRLTAGHMWQKCTRTNNEACVPCDNALLKRHEEFVAWDGGECNVKCKNGYFRSLPDGFCRPCTTNAADVTGSATGAAHTLLTQCTYFTDAVRMSCDSVNVV
jgi:hypothetical protein